MPFGPQSREEVGIEEAAKDIACAQSTAALSVDVEFGELMSIVEKQLSSVAGHDDKQRVSHSGRSQGLKVVPREAITQVAGVAHETKVAKAWQLTANWLSSLALPSPIATVLAA